MVAFVMLICFLITSFGWLVEAYRATEKQVEDREIRKKRKHYNIDVR